MYVMYFLWMTPLWRVRAKSAIYECLAEVRLGIKNILFLFSQKPPQKLLITYDRCCDMLCISGFVDDWRILLCVILFLYILCVCVCVLFCL